MENIVNRWLDRMALYALLSFIVGVPVAMAVIGIIGGAWYEKLISIAYFFVVYQSYKRLAGSWDECR